MRRNVSFVAVAGFALAAVLAAPAVRADNLLENGDFESALEPAWQQSASGASYVIDRGTGYDPDPDYEGHVLKNTGTGWARLSQTVWIPSTEVEISMSLKLYAYATSTAWGAAALTIEYLDAAQVLLGETRFGNWTHYCTWQEGPALRLMGMPSGVWFDHAFSLTEELQLLPAVDPAAVEYLRVSLYTQAYDC